MTLIYQTSLAAQECLVLGDTNSSFYYNNVSSPISSEALSQSQQKKPKGQNHANIIPWQLRVLATRLQSIAYKDPKREISGYYDLARSARQAIKVAVDQGDEEAERSWKIRLKELGVHVGNALIDSGDLDCAIRHFESLLQSETKENEKKILAGRVALLKLRIGDLESGKKALFANKSNNGSSRERDDTEEASLLTPLLSMSQGHWADAVNQWRDIASKGGDNASLAQQNQAVCLIYTGKVNEVCFPFPFLLF